MAVDGYAVVYVDSAALEERVGSGNRDTSLSWVVAYLQKLDAEAASGSARLKPETPVYVTADESFDLEGEGLRFLFNQEYTSGAFYTSVIGIDGSDVTDSASASYAELRYADFFDFAAWEEGTFVEESSAMDKAGQFLAKLDWSPLWVTLKTTGTAIVLVFVLGLLAAWWSLRIPSRAQDIADSIFTIPMVLPPTVCGFVLLLLLGNNTALGRWFIDIGFPLIFSWPATVLAAVVVSFPLMYRSARGAFEGIDRNMLDAARTLGWSEGQHLLQAYAAFGMVVHCGGHGACLCARVGRVRSDAVSCGKLRGNHANHSHRHLFRMDERKHRCRLVLDGGYHRVQFPGDIVHKPLEPANHALSLASAGGVGHEP